MTEQRPRLLIPPDAPPLGESALQALRKHFEIVTTTTPAIQPGVVRLQSDDPIVRAIREAGRRMIDIDPDEVRKQNAVERLAHLQAQTRSIMHDVLKLDHFEVRLTNPHTGQLEIVMAVGIEPLGVGEKIYAHAEDNGISGFVAVTGEPYLCLDTEADPRYIPGLDDAAESITVPLRVGSEVIGVINVEAAESNTLSEMVVHYLEMLGFYLGIALHLLNLLLVQRSSTRDEVADALTEDVGHRLDSIEEQARLLRDATSQEASRTVSDEIMRLVRKVRKSLVTCKTGPSSLLGVDAAIEQGEHPPQLLHKRVLIVDDDASIRSNIARILRGAGCEVEICRTGREALQTLASMNGEGKGAIDLLVSDVRLPDLTGYEVFRHAREHHPNMPVILMTGFGYDPHHSIVRASQEGLQSILFKPFKARQLLDELVRACSPEATDNDGDAK